MKIYNITLSYSLYLITFIILTSTQVYSQNPADVDGAILTQASIQNDDIVLNFDLLSAKEHTIHRIEKNISTEILEFQNDSSSTFNVRLENIKKNEIYALDIKEKDGNRFKYGSIFTAIELEPIHDRGIVILLVDDRFEFALASEISTLSKDLEKEGWQVIIEYANSNAKVTEVKSQILNIYHQNPSRTKSVFIIGHVPVPYSGDHAEDGHTSDAMNHRGAWPTDAYYGDVDGLWTDATVHSLHAVFPENHNIPGDGKFDQTLFPSEIELAVGRVDFYNMPIFKKEGQSTFKSELSLLKKYLRKNHAYRSNELAFVPRALIQDQLDFVYDIRYSSSTYKTAQTLFGKESVDFVDYANVQERPYQITHLSNYCQSTFDACIHSVFAQDFVEFEYKGLFNFFLGSYIGDYNTKNNLLRASLASGNGLIAAWSGRPEWLIGSLALGETMGDVALRTMNNTSMGVSYYKQHRSINLLGDPTLTAFPSHDISPQITSSNYENERYHLTWNSNVNSEGTFIYIKESNETNYKLWTPEAIKSNEFWLDTATSTVEFPLEIMIRDVVLETTHSGSFYRLSNGVSLLLEGESNTAPSVNIEVNNVVNSRSYTVDIEFSEPVVNFDPQEALNFMNNDEIQSITYEHNSVHLKVLAQEDTGYNHLSILNEKIKDSEGMQSDSSLDINYYYNVTEDVLIPNYFDFNQYVMVPFYSNDGGLANIQNDGKTLALQDDAWKFIFHEYQITPNTIMELEFRSVREGAVHGLAFANDNQFDPQYLIQLFGKDRLAQNDFQYDYKISDNWNKIKIRVGDYFNGNFEQLLFISENLNETPCNTKIRNLCIYESSINVPSNLGDESDAIAIQKFDRNLIEVMNDTEDLGISNVSFDQTTLLIAENTCRQYPLNIEVKANTVLELDFLSTQIADVHGIALIKDKTLTKVIKFTGMDSEGVLIDDEYNSTYEWQHYKIYLAQYVEEDSYDHIVFMMSDDNDNFGTSYFRNLKIYHSLFQIDSVEVDNDDVCIPSILDDFSNPLLGWKSIFSDAQINIENIDDNQVLHINSPQNHSNYIYLDHNLSALEEEWGMYSHLNFEFKSSFHTDLLIYLIDENNEYYYSTTNVETLDWTINSYMLSDFVSLSNPTKVLDVNNVTPKKIFIVIRNNMQSEHFYLDNLSLSCESLGEAKSSDQIENRSAIMDPNLIVEQFNIRNVDMEVFPNPASDVVNIKWDYHLTGQGNIDIVNVQGKLIKSTSVGLESGFYKLPIYDLIQGQYFIQIKGQNFSQVENLIVH